MFNAHLNETLFEFTKVRDHSYLGKPEKSIIKTTNEKDEQKFDI